MSRLLNKKRDELYTIGSIRITYSLDDVLIEDFIYDMVHPYVIYDMYGNVTETNINGCEKPFWNMYTKEIDTIKEVIAEFGVDA